MIPFQVRAAPGRPRRVLGIDPGTHCGWCVVDIARNGSVTPVAFGTWHLDADDKTTVHGPLPRHPGYRWAKLCSSLSVVLLAHRPDRVAYEKVHHHNGTLAAHVYGGVEAMLELACLPLELVPIPVHVAHVKQQATGHGRAEKEEMVRAAGLVLGREPGPDEADALFVALAAPASILRAELAVKDAHHPRGGRKSRSRRAVLDR